MKKLLVFGSWVGTMLVAATIGASYATANQKASVGSLESSVHYYHLANKEAANTIRRLDAENNELEARLGAPVNTVNGVKYPSVLWD